MLVILLDIVISVRLRKRAVAQSVQTWTNDTNNGQRQKNVQKQMFILMLASIGIFLITSLPQGVGKLTLPSDEQLSASVTRIITTWTILGWVQSLNYAVSECGMRGKKDDYGRLLRRSISIFIVWARHYFEKSSNNKWNASPGGMEIKLAHSKSERMIYVPSLSQRQSIIEQRRKSGIEEKLDWPTIISSCCCCSCAPIHTPLSSLFFCSPATSVTSTF